MRFAVPSWLLLSFLLVACCTSTPAHSPDPPKPYLEPVATLALDGDQDFTSQERDWVAEAAQNLATQTNGYIHIAITYDLNFWDDDSLRRAVGRDVIVRVSKDSGPVSEFDARHCCLLGLTRHFETLEQATTVYIVHDRIEQLGGQFGGYHNLFISVVMHELMHALGCNHVRDPNALMAASTQEGAPTRLNEADYREFCRAWGCSVHRLSNGRF